jgi:hypothetical protein
MNTEIKLEIQAQPDDQTCGPTCLHSLYRHWGLSDVTLKQVIAGVERLRSGGTIAELLACDALRRGFAATIYTYHLQMFDPTWFADDGDAHDPEDLQDRLRQQLKVKPRTTRLRVATRACQEFLRLGGVLKMQDLTSDLIVRYLSRGVPIITGLSSTFLYRETRALMQPKTVPDDVRGTPQGHFVMLVGYDGVKREVLVADPLDENPPFHTAKYRLSLDRLMNAILLGILTNDANLLIVQPRRKGRRVVRSKKRSPRSNGNLSGRTGRRAGRPPRSVGVPKPPKRAKRK